MGTTGRPESDELRRAKAERERRVDRRGESARLDQRLSDAEAAQRRKSFTGRRGALRR